MRVGLFVLLIIAMLCIMAAAQRRTPSRSRSSAPSRAPQRSQRPRSRPQTVQRPRAPTRSPRPRARPQRPISRTPQRPPRMPQRPVSKTPQRPPRMPQRPISKTPQRPMPRPMQQQPQYPTAGQYRQMAQQQQMTQQPRFTPQQARVVQQQQLAQQRAMQQRMAQQQQQQPQRRGFLGFFGGRQQPQQQQQAMQRPMGIMGNPNQPAPRLAYDTTGFMNDGTVAGGRAPVTSPRPQPRPQAPPMTFQPGQQLNRVQTRDVLIRAMRDAGITNPRAQANILANIEVESRMVPKTESMNYSPAGLRAIFPKYFNQAQANQYGRGRGKPANEVGIANRAYGGRMGNGPTEGYTYRGRGYIQLTGRENYERLGQRIGENLVQNPDLVNRPDVAARVAAHYFAPYPQQQLTDINRVIQIVGPADRESFPERRRLAENWYREINGMQ